MMKVKPVKLGKTERMSFSHIDEVISMPNLIEVQKNSYQWFLDEGLKEVFHDIGTIEDYTGNLALSFVDFRLDKEPKYSINFLSWSFSLPYAVYLILIIVLIWASINVVNCTDGVDGLSAGLAVVSIGTFLLAYWEELGDYATAGIVFIGALLAYLWQNAKPSTLLMGDAGSRAMGFFLAVLALKSSHPFAFLLAALVFIVDGSLGILKISFKRFLHISILKNTLTPLHDHVRKRLGWSDEQVVARWLILQAVASAWLLLLVR